MNIDTKEIIKKEFKNSIIMFVIMLVISILILVTAELWL